MDEELEHITFRELQRLSSVKIIKLLPLIVMVNGVDMFVIRKCSIQPA